MNFQPKTPFRLLLALGLAAPALLTLPSCGEKKAELPVNSKDTETTYRTDTVQLRNLAQDLRFTGKVSYDQRRVDQVFPVVSGTVLNVSANLGAYVQQGQALATVQSADVSGYLNDYNSAKSDYALAQRTADNTEQLYKTNFASQQDLIAAREGLAKALELAAKVAQNSPVTNFAVLQALPRIAEANPAEGYLLESLMAAVAGGSDEAKTRMRAFLEGRAAKVQRS